MKLIRLSFICVLFLINLSCGSKEQEINEFDILCSQFTSLYKTDDVSKLTPEEKNRRFLSKLEASLPKESNAYIAWDAVSAVDPEMRYALLVEAAESSSHPNWQCDEMASKANEVGLY